MLDNRSHLVDFIERQYGLRHFDAAGCYRLPGLNCTMGVAGNSVHFNFLDDMYCVTPPSARQLTAAKRRRQALLEVLAKKFGTERTTALPEALMIDTEDDIILEFCF